MRKLVWFQGLTPRIEQPCSLGSLAVAEWRLQSLTLAAARAQARSILCYNAFVFPDLRGFEPLSAF